MCPVLPVLLELVRGPDRLPADDELQEMLRGKLRILPTDSDEVKAVFTVKNKTKQNKRKTAKKKNNTRLLK